MKSVVTSFNGLFAAPSVGAPTITRIRIPILQRDYAQGREDANTARIRGSFLDVLHGALTGPGDVTLDFIFGEVRDGAFTPLDGQQRLTTLFLLHWYLAARSDGAAVYGRTRFTYETRASARDFCDALVAHRPSFPCARLSTWIEDQPWFLSTWRHDPTVRAMLVMLDAIHARFLHVDVPHAWRRLVDADHPAVTFHLLPIEDMGSPDALYIKMNSRGKPLTPFESFKARFERRITEVDPVRGKTFADKVDGAWSDVLWYERGDDDVIDDEFMRYLLFVTEVCEWTEKRAAVGEVEARAFAAFGPSNPHARAHLDLLFSALDAWCGDDPPRAFFARLLTIDRHEPAKLTLYAGRGGDRVDLFAACCRSYGNGNKASRDFSLARTLLLYAAVVHRIGKTTEFPRRLRTLRNLIEASGDAISSETMPSLLPVVRRFVIDGDLDALQHFKKRQVEEERQKAKLLTTHPDLAPALCRLEDHPLLRGCLAAFALDLEPDVFARRAAAFEELFADKALRGALTGALLACGDYAQPIPRFTHRFQFGSASQGDTWSGLFDGSGRGGDDDLRHALATLLDQVAFAEGEMAQRLDAVSRAWLAEREAAQELDWRYYFVKYPAMREGTSGIYVGLNGRFGYSLCMLDKVRLSSNYRDPYLSAIMQQSGAPASAVRDPWPWFTGYENVPRWMRLARSGGALRCVESGIALQPSKTPAHTDSFAEVCARHGVGVDGVMKVPQITRDGRNVDTRDRVELGAALLRDLIAAGC